MKGREAMAKSAKLTEFQLNIMDVLWNRGEATINEVHEELRREKKVARATVATMLIRLEKQGVIGMRKHDVLNIYFPLLGREETKQTMLRRLVDTLFEGDTTELVCHLLREGDYSADDVEKISALIEKYEANGGSHER